MHTLVKAERLHRQKAIEILFKNGREIYIFPFRVIWFVEPELNDAPAKILISVPKRHIKKAVQRNLIKRRIRESYRLQNTSFCDFFLKENKTCNFTVIYTTKEVLPYKLIEGKISTVLNNMITDYEKSAG